MNVFNINIINVLFTYIVWNKFTSIFMFSFTKIERVILHMSSPLYEKSSPSSFITIMPQEHGMTSSSLRFQSRNKLSVEYFLAVSVGKAVGRMADSITGLVTFMDIKCLARASLLIEYGDNSRIFVLIARGVDDSWDWGTSNCFKSKIMFLHLQYTK